MNFNKYVKWVVLAAVVCLVVGTAGLYNLFRSTDGFAAHTIAVDEQKTFSVQQVDSVKANSAIFELNAVPVPGDEIRVQWKGKLTSAQKDNFRLDAAVRNGALEINLVPKRNINWGFDALSLLASAFSNREKAVLEIALPAKLYRSLELTTNTGNLNVETQSAETVTLGADTGNIAVRDTKANRLEVKADTGNIRLSHTEGELKLTSDTGNITADLDTLRHNVTVQTNTGNASINANSAPAMEVNLQADTGRVSADVPRLQTSQKEQHALHGRSGSGGPYVNMRSDTGNLDVTVLN